MPNKDPEKRREAMRKYRGNLSAERKREINAKSSEYHRQRDKTMGKPHKRVYTKNGGVWKCAMCGATHEDGVQLDIHHKDQNRYNNNFSNLVCLCKQCHDGQIPGTDPGRYQCSHLLQQSDGDVRHSLAWYIRN